MPRESTYLDTDRIAVRAQHFSPTSKVVDINPIKNPISCNPETIFQFDDLELCTIHTEDDNLTLDSAGNPIEQNDRMSFLVYPEEDKIAYMIPVPKGGTPRDTSLIPITIMIVKSIGIKQSQAILKSTIRSWFNKNHDQLQGIAQRGTTNTTSVRKESDDLNRYYENQEPGKPKRHKVPWV